eukprot:Awhi_evm1s695
MVYFFVLRAGDYFAVTAADVENRQCGPSNGLPSSHPSTLRCRLQNVASSSSSANKNKDLIEQPTETRFLDVIPSPPTISVKEKDTAEIIVSQDENT